MQTRNLNSNDTDLLEVVSHDLAQREIELFATSGSVVYVSRRSLGPSKLYLSAHQVASDTADRTIPDGIVADLQRRNKTSVNLWPENVTSKHVKICESGPILWHLFTDASFPDAKLLATFWRPAYTESGDQSFVRMWLSPTGHGATGSYLLHRSDRRWTVEWFELAWYL